MNQCHIKTTALYFIGGFRLKENPMKLDIPKILSTRPFKSCRFYSIIRHNHRHSSTRSPHERQYLSRRFSSNELTDKLKWVIPSGYKTSIKIYNPILKHKVPLVLERKSHASWYMCGPTVYDSAHLGHACCYVKFDIIRRILQEFFGINVVTAMSVTDVDDKIIRRAIERNEDISAISNKYEIEFWEDMKSLNVIPPNAPLKVTKYIDDIISFVTKIINAGMAYSTVDGCVYFDTASYKNYGKFVSVSKEILEGSDEWSLSNKKPDAINYKKSSMDFALWKGNADTLEIGWPSPWGRGRPGWHIECSAMASKFFGSKIDLHSGGVDLVFPHHENEEAQSCAHHGIDQWVNYWIHTGHLHLKGQEKMSKSLKNTLSIRDFLSDFTANQFRMFCLLSHYRFGVAYTHETMGNAVAIMKKIESFLADVNAYVLGQKEPVYLDESELEDHLCRFELSLQNHLADDFNTPAAMSDIINLITYSNKVLNPSSKRSKSNFGISGNSTLPMVLVASLVKRTLENFGISFITDEGLQNVPCTDSTLGNVNMKQIIDGVVGFRQEVRSLTLDELNKQTCDETRKDYLKKIMNACDSCRKDMASGGVIVKDHGKKSSWNISEAEKKS